jgi:iron complex transport system substrate-binding protein
MIPKSVVKLVTLLLIVMIITIASAVSYPLTLTDELGRTITLEREPERIISMVPSHTEMICALDACDKLIGIDTFSNYPEDVLGLPRLGGALTGYDGGPDLEAIVALSPDLVVVSEYGELASFLEELGITTYAGSPQTVEDIFEYLEVIGQLVNRSDQAAALSAQIESDLDGIAQLVEGATRPSVYYEIDASPFSVGPDSFIGQLIALAGGETIVTAEMGDFPMLDPEFIVAQDPDMIILASAPYGESIETLQARPGWQGLSAIIDGRVIELTEAQNDLTARPGPRIADVVRFFAQMFHPDLVD